ncbi:MAG: flagellar filament capping protein FliD [Bacillota bacterium]
MASVSELNRQVLRFSGMSSGLDTESIVESLLKVDQFKVDKQQKLKTKLEWKSEAYRDVNLQLRTFRQNNMSVLNAATNMFSSDAYKTYKTTMLTDSNAVSVSANSAATAGTMTINSITRLAKAASQSSAGIFSGDISLETALADLDFANDLTFEDGEISFSINGETFAFDEETSLSTVINTVNANSKAGVTMSYSSLKKGFTITAKETGADSTVNIVNLKGNAFSDENSAFGIDQGEYHGQNALLSIDSVTVEKSTNTFTIDGITYTLKGETNSAVSFSVERDITSTYDKIVSFINNYNELISGLQSKIDEETYSAYEPLTDDEREALSETEATKWEEKAKSGLLRYDSNISSLLSTMRQAFYEAVQGTGKSPADIGLSTGSYADKGKIIINADKLKEALENNPDEVARIFTNASSSTDTTTKYKESGLVARISNAMSQYTETSTSVTLANNDEAVTKADERLEQLQDWLQEREDSYWKRFTAMETAIATLNSQTSWLQSQLGALSS